jgi:hypothetical protein
MSVGKGKRPRDPISRPVDCSSFHRPTGQITAAEPESKWSTTRSDVMRPQNAYPPILGKIARFLEETDVMSTNSEQVTALIKVLPILNRVGEYPHT